MIKEALEFLFAAGQEAHRDQGENDKVSEVRKGLFADAEGTMATALNQEIERRDRVPGDIQRTEQASDVASFVAMVKLHKTEGKAEVFVGPDCVVGVLDMAGWRRHIIRFPLHQSLSWRFWSGGRTHEAEDVADNVAAYIKDVAPDPVSGETLLRRLSGLDWISEESTRVVHTQTGLKITQSTSDRLAELPAMLSVQAPVYEFEDVAYALNIRLAAKRVRGERAIVFTPIGVSQQERHARIALLESIRKGLDGVPVHSGVPALGFEE